MRNKCEFLLISLLSAVIISGQFGSNPGQICKGNGNRNEIQISPDGVCSSVEIDHTFDQFKMLENCTIIEGYVRITVFENVDPEIYDKLRFSELREITAYLVVYRLQGLKSLSRLFPNLAVIGGRQLFNSYSLIVYEMTDLDDIGLLNLQTISRGDVRIAKSPLLCYINTVDWGRLGVAPGAQDFKDNKMENQCANFCPNDCPTTVVGNVEAKRCWNSHHCQKGLNCRCKVNQTCMDNGTCCHENCLGGCSGPGPGNCYSCKGVTHNGVCLKECPPDTYLYAERRCLTAKECLAIVNNTGDRDKNTKILQSDKAELRVCVSQCPPNYTVQEEGKMKNLECIKCQGFCPKVCNATEVTSIQIAQKLQGCSKIEGSLLIMIMGGSNVAYELEKSLGSIKEITEYLIIQKSYVLVTLYFLKSLEIIGGEKLSPEGMVVTVMDNSNLQDLFPEEQMKKMKIRNARVSFHSNRKLCPYKIDRFVKLLNLTHSIIAKDIGENGNLMPCNEHELSLNVTKIYHNTVVLHWSKYVADSRHLLAYIINYKEIKGKNDVINIYQGRDACSADAWMTSEAMPSEDSKPYEAYGLKNLNSYTTYAVYVQAYTLSTATHAAMTNVTIFTTNPYYPSEPLDLEVRSDDAHELYVKWQPPRFPNGIVTHYKVLYQKQELDIKSFEQRNYCLEPISGPSENKKTLEEETDTSLNASSICCGCPKSKEELDAEARKREIEIYFENYLQDQVYCQRYDTLPADIALTEISLEAEWSAILNMDRPLNSRNISHVNGDEVVVPYTSNTSSDNMTHINLLRNNSLSVLIQEVIVNDTEVYLPNLEHFQDYSIEVQACHDTNPNEPIGTKLCSNRAMTAGRTKASWIMDKINESSINAQIIKNTSTDVIITWDPPPNPNGLILTYNILYRKADHENSVPLQICINIREYQKYSGGRLTGLDSGKWIYQINAVSLAGNTSFTDERHFTVPDATDVTSTNNAVITISVLAIGALFITVVIVVMYARYRFKKEEMTVISFNENYVSSEPMFPMDGWEVERDKIKLIKELGQGSFGMVYEGIAKGLREDPNEEISVAVKTVNDRASFNDKREFLKEACTMKAFDCFHVVKLLGVVSTGQPALVIMELMALGDLKNYLREHRPDEHERPGVTPPNLLDILQMAGEIADGMAYLADKKFVHRDLAARNCMVAEDKTVKIGDFGMTRDIYETDYYRKGGKGMLPVRWMAPESLKDGVFTSMSDVWSYGIVMWEMVTLAAQPYQGLSNEEVVKYISEDNTMEIPDRCPYEMAYLMRRCWAKKPKNRPSFKEIIEYLLPHLNPRFEKVSYFYSEGGGPVGMDGSEAEEFYSEKGSSISGSINSLSGEASAGPQHSLTRASGSYKSRGSSHPSGGSLSLYDDGVDPERFNRDDVEKARPFYPQRQRLSREDDFIGAGGCSFYNEFGVDFDDSSQSYGTDDFQAIPLVKICHPSVQSHEQSRNDSTQHNMGLVELQPLINRDSGTSSHRHPYVQSPSTHSSEYIGHNPPNIPTYNLRTPANDPQILQSQHRTAAINSQRSPPAGISSQFGAPDQPYSTHVQPPGLSQPVLRLPPLNQAPSGGFSRTPLYKQGDKTNYSSRNRQSISKDKDHQESTQPATANNLVDSSRKETSPVSSARQSSPQSGAIVSSSDDSKGSSKSSGSHSHINGLANGHIPMTIHRTSPC